MIRPLVGLVVSVGTASCWLGCAASETSASPDEPVAPIAADSESAQSATPAVAAAAEPTNLPEWVDVHGLAPAAYVNRLFDTADLVIIGDMMIDAEYCNAIGALLASAHRDAGVRVFATELARASSNERLARLVTADRWEDDLAIEILRDGPTPARGFREYVDILRAAWHVNRSLPDGAEPLRVVGLDGDWEHVEIERATSLQSVADILNRQQTDMFEAVDPLLQDGAVVLAHVVYQSAALAVDGSFAARCRSAHGERVTTALLHQVSGDPMSRGIENVAESAGTGPRAFPTPSPSLVMPDADLPEGFPSMDRSYEHWIYLQPVASLTAVTWIPGFIQESDLDEAIEIGREGGWLDPSTPRSADAVNAAYATYPAVMRRRMRRPA